MFSSLPLLFVYLRMRMSSNPRSIAGVPFDSFGHRDPFPCVTVKAPPFYLSTVQGRANTQVGRNIIFFLVSQILLQVLSRSSASLPLFWEFLRFSPSPGRGLFTSLSEFTTQACLLQRCTQCCQWWVSILSTNPLCALLHSHRQGIFSIPSDWLHVPDVYKICTTKSRNTNCSARPHCLSINGQKNQPQPDREPCSAMEEPWGVPDHGGMPKFRSSCSWNTWFPLVCTIWATSKSCGFSKNLFICVYSPITYTWCLYTYEYWYPNSHKQNNDTPNT